MNGRRRYLRPLTLFILMGLFSLSLVGQLDSRLNIGGFDWETTIDYEAHYQSRDSLGIKPMTLWPPIKQKMRPADLNNL